MLYSRAQCSLSEMACCGMVWCGVVWCGGAQCVFAVIIAAAAAVAPKTTTINGKELNKRIGDEANRANKFL